ncbi:hypothetical protein DCS_02418 [Drechmeria coniospora]|uniref:Early meiotic induction protein 1 n=1 Tax=Drechmeria coniospora TaxID=98403 RepID=A0A151GVZ6_DRECN|nr:hypothetical protein DCS_02418 [Drechmeria coniospora]KYK61276.1 hypothetical protein DCS_02418 [Drechmeria coniospora]ODA81040.1 hypothetical protein RJ55_04002 [Drechmeria coniospora]
MGWLWASSSAPKPLHPVRDHGPSTISSNPPLTAQTATPSEPIDPEMQKFLDLFKSDDPTASSTRKTTSQSQRPDGSESKSFLPSWISLKTSPTSTATTESPEAPVGDALSEFLLPTDMSCRQAFDLAWSCNGLGGQFNAVYRYGEMRSCSEQWDDFWFCMRSKSYTGEMKSNMIRAHYRNKAYRKYGNGKPSSEDVWEGRTERVPPGTVFTEPVAAPTMSDDEWRQKEAERRGKIREGLEDDTTT